MKAATNHKYHIRWMVKFDMEDVLAIERDCYTTPWTEDDFRYCLRQRNCIAMVVESLDGKSVIGYVLWEMHRGRLQIINFAVSYLYRRSGVGTQIVQKLIGKLTSHQRTRITLELRESNLAAQLFFRSQGFVATKVVRRFYDDTGESAYVMEYRLGKMG